MRFCNGIPNDRYRIVADENRWQVGYASPFRDGRGGNVFRPGAAAHGWRPSPSPQPPSSPPLGARKGEGAPSPSPGSLPLPHGERKGGRGGAGAKAWWPAHAMVACWERGPLARILMDGTGVHWLQRWYCGARLAALTFPPAPFLSPAGGEKGGGCCLPFPLAPSPLRSSLGVLVPAPVGAGFQPARWAAGREGI